MADATKAAKDDSVVLDASGSMPAIEEARAAAEVAGVKITLSHHVDIGVDGLPAAVDNPAVGSKKPGDVVTWPRSVASAAIHAALTTVNPADVEAVSKALA